MDLHGLFIVLKRHMLHGADLNHPGVVDEDIDGTKISLYR